MTTMTVKDAAGATEVVEKPLPPGRAGASAARPVALATEDKTSLDAIATAAAAMNARDEAIANDGLPVDVNTRFIAENAVASFTRPNNTTTYSPNDLVGSATTGSSVVALSFIVSEDVDLPVFLRGMFIDTNDLGPGVASACFRAKIYQSNPAGSSGIVSGDNAPMSLKKAGYLGKMEGTFEAFSDGSRARLAPVFIPSSGVVMPCDIITRPTIGSNTVYALFQTLTTFIPTALTLWTARMEGFQGRA